MQEIFLCSISNCKSGACAEDCAYCMQSSRAKASAVYDYKDIQTVLKEAQLAASFGVLGFCLVTSGRGLDAKKLDYIKACAQTLKSNEQTKHLHLIGCNGKASYQELCELKAAGIDSYNHNLETARSYFKQICTTHTYDERLETNNNAISAGLGICCGAIFGLGESKEQRDELLEDLASLRPHTSTINFFIHHPALRLAASTITKTEALSIISKAKSELNNTRLMAAGGREAMFGDDFKAMFDAGISSIVLGDYLATKGAKAQRDLDLINSSGYSIAKVCEH